MKEKYVMLLGGQAKQGESLHAIYEALIAYVRGDDKNSVRPSIYSSIPL